MEFGNHGNNKSNIKAIFYANKVGSKTIILSLEINLGKLVSMATKS